METRQDTSKFRKNIFVTQLNHEDVSDYVAIPVVKDTADKLLLTGQSTLQHTLLLRKELEAEEVNAQLQAKRAEFAAKLSACSQRHHNLLVKQQALRVKTRDASAVIQDQNVKQRRALRRCEADAQERMKMEDDLTRLGEVASSELVRRHRLKEKLSTCKKSADFLLEVVNNLPSDYISTRDDPLKGLMDRHSHLVSTEKDLTSHVLGLADELKSANDTLRHVEESHGYTVLELNGKLEDFRHRYEILKSKNESLEAEAGYAHTAYKDRILFTGDAFRAIDGLVERCGGTADVLSRGRERAREMANRAFEKQLSRKNRNTASQPLERSKTMFASEDSTGIDVILNGISVCTENRKDIVDEAAKRTRLRDHTSEKIIQFAS